MSINNQIKALQSKGEKVYILDITGAPKCYLSEITEEFKDIHIKVRDYQEKNSTQSIQLAKNRAINNITYTQMDAFDVNNYLTQKSHPNIVIISGIFELFDNNNLINNAINGVATIIQKGGYLIYRS